MMGLFAAQKIKANMFIGYYSGELLSETETVARCEKQEL